MVEPLQYFLRAEGFDRSRIADWIIGDKYVGLKNSDGNVGVCATLDTKMSDRLFYYGKPDISIPAHRIILNAWFNSICNYRQSYDHISDIFDSVEFADSKRIVMVGFFESLYEKFKKAGIKIKVFDYIKENNILCAISEMKSAIAECETLILSGTTIFNNTFSEIISQTSDHCNIYLLGPSNILSKDMFKYKNIKIVFGSVFKKNDTGVFKMIKEGHGTKGFLRYLDKVYISRD